MHAVEATIKEDIVVAGAAEIAVTVSKDIINRQKPQRLIDIQYFLECRKVLIFVETIDNATRIDQFLPLLFIVLGLDLVAPLVLFQFVAEETQTARATEVRRYFPASTFCCAIPFFQEIAIELLLINIQPPVLAIDHHTHEIGLQGWQVLA